MTDPRTRWTDERLDDWRRDFLDMKALAQQVPVMQEQLKGIADDAAVARRNTHALRNDMATNAAQQAADRKADRRWLTGTLIATAGVIVTALIVLQGFLH